MKKLTIKECKSICNNINERVVDVDIIDQGYRAVVIAISKCHLVKEYMIDITENNIVKLYKIKCTKNLCDLEHINSIKRGVKQ